MPTNILIIGAGPAGEAAAKSLRRLSAAKPVPAGLASPGPTKDEVAVTVVEKDEAGGLCLNKGCIPSKTLLEHVHHKSKAGQLINWVELQQFKQQVVQGIRSQLASSLKQQKINLIKGTARFENASTLSIQNNEGSKLLPFDRAILTTGTEIFFPPPFDQFRDELLDSDRILEIEKTPESIIIIGGGAVGCEFACLLNAAGSKVTLIEMTEALLPGEDAQIVSALTNSFESRGIAVKTAVKVQDLKKSSQGWIVSMSNGESIESRHVLVCAGRVPKVAALQPEKAGIKCDARSIIVNARLQTSNPHIFAAGDVAGTRLAHAAAVQGEIAAANVMGDSQTFDDRFTPRCLYTWPEVASVGLWKHQLDRENRPVKTARAFFKGCSKALAANEPEGFVQIVYNPGDQLILGAQIIGAHATELIHIFSVALKKEMTTRELADVMFAHPTLGETIRDAARR